MWLKVLIILLFIGLVLSLFTSLAFLFKDRGEEGRRPRSRMWNALSIRLMLAGALVVLLVYGVFTGQLGSKAPWDARYQQQPTPPVD